MHDHGITLTQPKKTKVKDKTHDKLTHGQHDRCRDRRLPTGIREQHQHSEIKFKLTIDERRGYSRLRIDQSK